MARKNLTKAQRDLKNKLDRTRRFLEKNIIQAKKNGWALKQGMWFGKHSAGLFGLVLANEKGLGKKDDLSAYFYGQFSQHSESVQAAAASGLHPDEVNCIIAGFDDQTDCLEELRHEVEDNWYYGDNDNVGRSMPKAWFDKEFARLLKEKKSGEDNYSKGSKEAKFYALGWRLAEKHVEKGKIK